MSDAKAVSVMHAEITGAEKDALLRFEERVTAAFAEWFQMFSSLPIAIRCTGVGVCTTAEALIAAEILPGVCHGPFRLDGDQKEVFCMSNDEVQKLAQKLPADRPDMQSPTFLVENYRAALANELAVSQLAVPGFLPAQVAQTKLAAQDLPVEPFLRFDYELSLQGTSGRLVRFVSMRLLSTIKVTSPGDVDPMDIKTETMTEFTQETPLVEKVEYAPLTSRRTADAPSTSIEALYDLHVDVIVELGRSRLQLRDILALGRGSVVELRKLAGDPVDLYVNDKKMGEGEVVVVDDHFAVRILHLITASERIKNLGE
jgi:flagellar motor switch protein FliN/FliY